MNFAVFKGERLVYSDYVHGRQTVLQKLWCQVGHISPPHVVPRAFTCLLQLRQAEKARRDNGMCFAVRI